MLTIILYIFYYWSTANWSTNHPIESGNFGTMEVCHSWDASNMAVKKDKLKGGEGFQI